MREIYMQIYTKMQRMANSDSRRSFSRQTYIYILYLATFPYIIFIFFKKRHMNKE